MKAVSIIVAICFLSLWSIATVAQSVVTAATVSGRVEDPSAAPMPGVTVALMNLDKNSTLTTATESCSGGAEAVAGRGGV